ncbi:MAG TPA: hypothetical protein VF771_14490 [Longimicrobiaceae bacterium]
MTTKPCVFCWTLARHSRPEEFYGKQQRVECPTCGTYRLDERSHQLVWELLGPLVERGFDHSPFPPAVSREIRRRYDESGGREVVIDEWERFYDEALERHGRAD